MTHEAMSPPTMRDVLRNRPFRHLLIGQFVSQLGDGLINLSLLIMINRLRSQSGAEAAIGILMICMTAPRVIFGLLAGVYVDRLDRKRLMVLSDVTRGIIVLACLFVQRSEDIWIYYVSAALMATVTSVFGPAKDASVPHLVPKDHLLIANSLSQTGFTIAITVGSALAGVLIGGFNSPVPAILFDAASFFVSAAFIIGLPIRHDPAPAKYDSGARRVWLELQEGLQYVSRQRILVGAIVGLTIVMLGIGAINVLFVPFLVNDLHMRETYLGFVDLTQMFGMVFVNFFISGIAARYRPAQIISAGIIGTGVTLAITGWIQTAWILFPLSALWGVFIMPVEASASVMMQSVPDRIRGRTLSATHTVVGTTNVISMALAGVVGAAIGARNTFIVGGVIGVMGGLLAWRLMRDAKPALDRAASQLTPDAVGVMNEDEVQAAGMDR